MEPAKDIKDILHKLGIAAVYLFGSRAQGLEKLGSDFDIGIVLAKPTQLKKKTEGLYQELYELFSDFYQTMADIDIVFLQEATGQLRYHVVTQGKVLFDLEPKMRQAFEDYTILEHADFEPHRHLLQEKLLESIL